MICHDLRSKPQGAARVLLPVAEFAEISSNFMKGFWHGHLAGFKAGSFCDRKIDLRSAAQFPNG